ncbi:MAG: zinc finger domain-containing protein [Candidatus Thermoplasmatota archaeon]|nr:zinc finger domain-containing protein [Candidatus Thermoplasmatota archaeon]MCL4444345.1 zinc finger domain-containing protein [Candidatus Thermoplasmatota archaeon]MCL5441657.1 zinc finger domain-containing protein [Candidatus Thermoplasmatota archaeon]MCL5667814.1 zinc finger domain-containing protein [Candidatus Thermoplasmatota archaeon]MCL5679095.1 zinc finger domain-containing protein [Candidatus Thermoplasmatota archaeon]
MKYKDTCTSCGIGLVEVGYSIFDCPNCGEEVIGRCKDCREHSTHYVCSACGFQGP